MVIVLCYAESTNEVKHDDFVNVSSENVMGSPLCQNERMNRVGARRALANFANHRAFAPLRFAFTVFR